MSVWLINSFRSFINYSSRTLPIPITSPENVHFLYAHLSPVFAGNILKRNYAAEASGGTKKGKVSGSGRRKEFPVEKDPYRLVNYCCGSNYFIEGEDVKLKPESEYPDWLWTIHTGPRIPLEQLDPNSKEYWIRVRILARKRINKLHRLRTKILRRFY